jgi:hypothetical protein
MSLREAAQQALEALEYINKYGFVLADYEGPMEQAITALRAALEQPEQEPMVVKDSNGLTLKAGWDDLPVGTPLYTHPPRREWRGLTEEEMVALAGGELTRDERMIARAIEAALKERNA